MSMCFMAGHADAPMELLPRIVEQAQQLVERWGVTRFLVGHYGNFDRLAVQAIKQLKIAYPQIKLILLLPYYSANQTMEISNEFDETIYPEGLETVPYRYAIVKANRWAVAAADHMMVHQHYSVGNTFRLMKYAQSVEKKGKLRIWRVE